MSSSYLKEVKGVLGTAGHCQGRAFPVYSWQAGGQVEAEASARLSFR